MASHYEITVDVRAQKYGELIGQMLIARHGLDAEPPSSFYPIHNVILNGEINTAESVNRRSFEEFKRLITRISERIQGMICIDYEGGRICRWGADMPSLPSAYVLSLSEESLEKAGELMGRQLSLLGIDMLLGPVVDLGGRASAFPARCYGSSAEEVICRVMSLLKGLNTYVWTCLKHYPGHGAVQQDSHKTLPFSSLDLEALHVHAEPFYRLAAQSGAIMTAHFLSTHWDRELPATFSPLILGRLREEFDGLIITDSLTMNAVIEAYGNQPVEAALAAIRAGADMLITGDLSFQEVLDLHASLLEMALKEKELARKIKASARKIQALFSSKRTKVMDKCAPLKKEVEEFTMNVAQKALFTKSSIGHPLLVHSSQVLVVAPALLAEKVQSAYRLSFEADPIAYYWEGDVEPQLKHIQAMKERAHGMTDVIVVTHNADESQTLELLVSLLLESPEPLRVRVCEANFTHTSMDWVPPAAEAICTFSGDPLSLSLAFNQFAGR